jgi:hypothetical protein
VENIIALQSSHILYTFVLRAEIATIFGPNVVYRNVAASYSGAMCCSMACAVRKGAEGAVINIHTNEGA